MYCKHVIIDRCEYIQNTKLNSQNMKINSCILKHKSLIADTHMIILHSKSSNFIRLNDTQKIGYLGYTISSFKKDNTYKCGPPQDYKIKQKTLPSTYNVVFHKNPFVILWHMCIYHKKTWVTLYGKWQYFSFLLCS